MPNPYVVPRELLEKFDVSGPRYTSYPTAPEWSDAFTPAEARQVLTENAATRAQNPLAIYVHIPFCVKLCSFCGCNVHITRDGDIVGRYLDALEAELDRVRAVVDTDRPVVQLHWGGGTPTHLDLAQIERLFTAIATRFRIADGAEISLEVHPSVTSFEQLRLLRDLGFNRISMGVQDFDPEVQAAVNRIQPYELTRDLIAECRRLGFRSINTDLMYGLPFQNRSKFETTMDRLLAIRPDRIALFSYAHVPWIKPAHKLLEKQGLPEPEQKLALMEFAIGTMLDAGYTYIGMDHFALPEDELSVALGKRTLRRNFMGYTTRAGVDMIAFGVSAIGELDGAYLQNQRKLPDYFRAIEEGTDLPIMRGMRLSADDRLRKDVIARISCLGELRFAEIEAAHGIDCRQAFADELARLAPLADDGLLRLDDEGFALTPRGQVLVRIVCMAFDRYLERRAPEERRFSRTI